MIGRLTLFAALAVATWVVVAVPTRMLAGDVQAIYAGLALLVCGIPALGTLGWTLAATKQAPHQQLVAALGGTGMRLLVTSVVAWLLTARVAFLRQEGGFGIWLLLAYLFTLALEVVIVLRGRSLTGTPHELAR